VELTVNRGTFQRRKRRKSGSTVCSKCGGQRDREGQRYCLACHAASRRVNRVKHSDLSDYHRHKANARAYANVHQRRGKLTPEPCSACGAADAEKHHDDYDKPLSVQWLCRPCHLEKHRNMPTVRVRQRRTDNRAEQLHGLTRDEQIAHIVAHIRWQARKHNAPKDWY
jgi:hypothetical protein